MPTAGMGLDCTRRARSRTCHLVNACFVGKGRRIHVRIGEFLSFFFFFCFPSFLPSFPPSLFNGLAGLCYTVNDFTYGKKVGGWWRNMRGRSYDKHGKRNRSVGAQE